MSYEVLCIILIALCVSNIAALGLIICLNRRLNHLEADSENVSHSLRFTNRALARLEGAVYATRPGHWVQGYPPVRTDGCQTAATRDAGSGSAERGVMEDDLK